MADMQQLRHMQRRGAILRILAEDYTSAMTGTSSLLGALDMLGYPLSLESLQYHLTYLMEEGYISIQRMRDLPGWRSDREQVGSPNTIRFARLSPKGLRLVNGSIPADPEVRF
jgi:hypothetical protein